MRVQSGFGLYLHIAKMEEKELRTRMDIGAAKAPALLCVTGLWMDRKLLIINILIYALFSLTLREKRVNSTSFFDIFFGFPGWWRVRDSSSGHRAQRKL